MTVSAQSNNPRFAYDSYRRFVQMYGEVVKGIGGGGKANPFEHTLEALKKEKGVERDIDLAAEDLKGLVGSYKEIYARETGSPFSDNPWEQLLGAVEAVFGSWNIKRAIDYRRVHKIPHLHPQRPRPEQ